MRLISLTTLSKVRTNLKTGFGSVIGLMGLFYVLVPDVFAPLFLFVLLFALLISESNHDGTHLEISIWLVFLFFCLIPALFFDVPEVVQRSFYILPIFLVLTLSRTTSPRKLVRIIVPLAIFAFLMLRAILFLGKILSPTILTTLGLGYDNSHHFAIFQAVLHTDQISRFSLDSPWAIPSWFTQHYPVGNQIVWGAVLSPLRLQNSTAAEGLVLFALTIVVALVGLILFSSKLIIKSCRVTSRISVAIISTFVSLFFVFGSFGYIVISGFPPLLTGCMLLVGILLIGGSVYSRFSTLLQICIVALIALTYVTLSVPAGLALLVLKSSQIRSMVPLNRRREALFFVATSSIGALLTLRTFQNNAGAMGWRQILEPGGIESLPAGVVWLAAIISLLFSVFAIKGTPLIRAIATLNIACWLFYIGIALATIYFNGYISYYAQKQGYVAIYVAVIASLVVAFDSPRSEKQIRRYIGPIFLSLFAILQFNHATQPKDFPSGFMSSVPRAIDRLTDPSTRLQQIIDGQQLLNAYDVTRHASMTLVLNSNGVIDLTSRWMNALNNTWTDKTWFFYNGADTWINRPELFEGLSSNGMHPVVVSDDISSIDNSLSRFLIEKGFQIIEVERN